MVPVVWYVAYVRPFEEFGGPLEISREEMLCLIPGEVIAIDSRQPEELGSKICLILRRGQGNLM